MKCILKKKKEMKRFLVMIKETSTNSSSSLSHRKQPQSLDMMKKQLRGSTGEWRDRPRGSSSCQGEEEKGSSMRGRPSVVLSLGLSAVHAACTWVVRADTERPTVFLTQGIRKGKLANCKYWSKWENPSRARGPAEWISTSLTDPLTTQIKSRFKAIQLKAKDLNRA